MPPLSALPHRHKSVGVIAQWEFLSSLGLEIPRKDFLPKALTAKPAGGRAEVMPFMTADRCSYWKESPWGAQLASINKANCGEGKAESQS